MRYHEALDAMKESKAVSRKSWDVTQEYCVLLPRVNTIIKIIPSPKMPNIGVYTFDRRDMEADDFYVIEKNEPYSDYVSDSEF